MKNFDTTLYFITDSTGLAEDEFLRRVEEALEGGATILQLREKNKSTMDYLGVGAIYPTTTKVKTVLTSTETLADICKAVPIPVNAIGGLNKNNIGVRHYFSEIFTCAEVGFGKDKPVIYQKALEHLETAKDETYVFEDMLFALNTAKTDGFPTVGVYDRHEVHQYELKGLADYYVLDFTDPILKTI